MNTIYGQGDLVLVNYTEGQIGASVSEQTNNARVSSALLEMSDPVTWLHLHETWPPEDVLAAASFDV